MSPDQRQFLLTAVWLFMRHGQEWRARTVCEALSEDDPRDGTVAAALAGMLLDGGEPGRALEVLRIADFPPELSHPQAVLEARALRMAGRGREADARWERYLEARKGASRKWIAK